MSLNVSGAGKFLPSAGMGILAGLVAFFLVATGATAFPETFPVFSASRTLLLLAFSGGVTYPVFKGLSALLVDKSSWPPPGVPRVYRPPLTVSESDWRKEVLDAWKYIVGVQMHFNQMVMQVRNFGITLVVASIGAAGFAIKEGVTTTVQGHRISVSSLLVLGGLVGWIAFYLLDRWYYHMLLVGAVAKATEIERAVRSTMPYIDVGEAITHYSRVRFRQLGGAELRARDKLDAFYHLIAVLLAATVYLTANLPSTLPHADPVNAPASGAHP
jgi:hypothetical protein